MALEYDQISDTKVLQIHEALKPHFLRRTKSLVLKLPPKGEVLVPVSLTPLQRKLYTLVLQKNYSLLRSLGVAGNGGHETRASPLHKYVTTKTTEKTKKGS
jgi:SNF2 family DNA or RNA helicase